MIPYKCDEALIQTIRIMLTHARMLEKKVGYTQKCNGENRLNCQTCMLFNENYTIQFVGNLFMQKSACCQYHADQP